MRPALYALPDAAGITGAEHFARRYPAVTIRPQQIIVDEGRLCTSAGAASFLSLTIYLIKTFCDGDIAHHVAKVLLIDIHKPKQGTYAIFSGQKNHSDDAIRSAQDTIEASIAGVISIESLAQSVALSRRSFIRRFKSATGNTPLEHVQHVRMETAKTELENQRFGRRNRPRRWLRRHPQLSQGVRPNHWPPPARIPPQIPRAGLAQCQSIQPRNPSRYLDPVGSIAAPSRARDRLTWHRQRPTGSLSTLGSARLATGLLTTL